MTRTVKFIRSCSPYTTGEIASFDNDNAERLIEMNAAVYHEEDKPKKLSSLKRRSLTKNRQVTTD